MKFSLIAPIFVSLFFVSVIGCGGGKSRPANLPALQPCTVKIVMGGTPVEGAIVSLSPAAGQWFGNAVTNATGTAKILTQGEFDGIPAGTYKVLVSKSVSSDPNWTRKTEDEVAPAIIHHIDLKFSDTVQTPLSCEVKDGINNFDFEVTAPKK